MTTDAEKIAVMQAHLRGEAIEVLIPGSKFWEPCPTPVWNWTSNDYRVKREPREAWLFCVNGHCLGSVFFNKRSADDWVASCPSKRSLIHVREVIE